MREALTNMFIHQDYADQRSCARIIIRPDETEFFNAGYSLTAVERLEEGGGTPSPKSSCRACDSD